MNNKEAFEYYTNTLTNPGGKIWESPEEVSKFFGAMNQLLYGVNPYEKKKLDCGCSDVPNGEIVENEGLRICEEHTYKYSHE